MADIFVAYKREDEARVRQLVVALEQRGWSVFWDQEVPAGEPWRSHLGKALADAHCVIVAWSRASVNSSWVMEEADDARRRGVLVPVLLEAVEQPLGFREIQAADLTGWQPGSPSPHFEVLLQNLSTRLRAAGTAPPSTPAPQSLETDAVMANRPLVPTRRHGAGRLVGGIVGGLVLLVLLFARFVIGPHDDPVSSPSPSTATQAAPTRPPAPVTASRPVAAGADQREGTERAARRDPQSLDVRAVIDDADGFTNVRSGKSASSAIVARVDNGEEFYTQEQAGDWWRIRTKDGKIGYMHRSRIRILK